MINEKVDLPALVMVTAFTGNLLVSFSEKTTENTQESQYSGLIDALDDPDPKVRAIAINKLAEAKLPRA